MSKAFDLLSESLNDAILDTQTKYLPRHKGKIDIKPSSFSQTARLNYKQKNLYIKITCFKGQHQTLEAGDFFLYSDLFGVFGNGDGIFLD